MQHSFDLKQQKKHLTELENIFFRIRACTFLHDIDPNYYNEKIAEYESQYREQAQRIVNDLQQEEQPAGGPGDMFNRIAEAVKPATEHY